MEWRISGAYVASCGCDVAEHRPIDGTLSDTRGGCKGLIVFGITNGRGHRSDLSGRSFAVINFFPEHFTDEAIWEMGLVIDDHANRDQQQDIEDIVLGTHGGPFADLAEIVGEFIGTEHASIQIERGSAPIVKVEGVSTFKFEPNLDEQGRHLVAGSPLFPFATHRIGGKTSGPPARAFGEVWTPHFGEYARFEIDDTVSAVGEQLRRLRS